MTATSRTRGCWRRTASTPSRSTRAPRILTCRSLRPIRSSSPSGLWRARSPVRKVRQPARRRFQLLLARNIRRSKVPAHVRACDHELSDFARRRGASILVDQCQAVAWKRIADRNSRVVSAAGIIDEPLHHRRFGGGVNQLDCCLRPEPGAQQIDIAPQCGVSTDANQSKGIARPLTTVREQRPQQSREREQDCDGLCADDIQNFARAGALRIEEVNTGACEQQRLWCLVRRLWWRARPVSETCLRR